MGVTYGHPLERELNDAVRLGEERRFSNITAYPFWYAFISSEIVDPVPNSLALNQIPTTIQIVMDRDTSFQMYYIKYRVQRTEAAGGVRRFIGGAGAPATTLVPLDTLRTVNEVGQVELTIDSHRARSLYGNNQDVEPVQADPFTRIISLQGSLDGVGMMRIPYLVPKQGTVTIRVRRTTTNLPNTTDFRINGCVFGYKIYG